MAKPDEVDGLPEVFSHLVGIIADVLADLGMDEATANTAATKAAETFQSDFAGTQVYFPKGHLAELAKRDREIYLSWRRHTNPAVIARNHNITQQRVYSIVKAQQKLPQNQMKGLFDGPKP